MSNCGFRRVFSVVVLLWAVSFPAFAVEWRTGSVSCRVGDTRQPAAYAAGLPPATQQAVVLGDIWSICGYFSGGGRTRIVQICVVAMCIALFIMMRKLNG
jgi:hypothetical protein